MGYSPWGHKGSDTTERLSTHARMSIVKVQVAQLWQTLCNPVDYIVRGIRSLSLLQGIFPAQVVSPGLLRGRQSLYQLCHQGSP